MSSSFIKMLPGINLPGEKIQYFTIEIRKFPAKNLKLIEENN